MSAVKLYVEGGGDSKELHIRCREGFRKLLERAGFAMRMPRIVAGGGRRKAFDLFEAEMRAGRNAGYPILLVDSEDPVAAEPWQHLGARDGWVRPAGAADDQAQLMVTCMETWVMADPMALKSAFGQCLQTSAILPAGGLEERPRDEIQRALQDATRACGSRRAYRKGERSFAVLAQLDGDRLGRHLAHFRRLLQALDRHLPP